MFFVQSANLLHSAMVTMFTQQYPWQRLSTPRDVSIVTDLTHSVYDLVFFFIDAYCACLVTRFVGMVTGLTRLPWQHISQRLPSVEGLRYHQWRTQGFNVEDFIYHRFQGAQNPRPKSRIAWVFYLRVNLA